MYYTSFTIEMPTEDATPTALATLAHIFAGCQCSEDCKCNTIDGQCKKCRFTTLDQGFVCTTAAHTKQKYYVHSVYTRPGEILQLDVYSEEQFTYEGLRKLVDVLRSYSKTGHIMMSHVHRDFLTGEKASGKAG
jgi:hypothetical protein